MPRINLDDRLAQARAEAGTEPRVLTWRGTDYVLPDDLPIIAATHVERRELLEAIDVLLGAGAATTVKPPVGLAEAEALLDVVAELYGITKGESSASVSS